MSRPVLVALMGLPGAGKTVVARRLAHMTGAVRLSRDDLRARWPAPLGYGAADKARLLSALLDEAGAELAAGRDVVLEGMPFSRVAERESARALAARHGAACVLALLDLPAAEARRRIAATGAHVAADRTPALVDDVAARFAPPDAPTFVLDAQRPAPALAEDVRRAMEVARER